MLAFKLLIKLRYNDPMFNFSLCDMTTSWFVYYLRCSDNSLYTGITTDINRRLDEHNQDDKKAAKYTKARRPVELVYLEPCNDKSAASKREYQLRKLPKKQKEALVFGYLNKKTN